MLRRLSHLVILLGIVLVSVSNTSAQPHNYNLSDVYITLEYEPAWNQPPYIITIRGSGDGTFVETGSDTLYFVVHRRDIRKILNILYEKYYFEFRDVYNRSYKVDIGTGGNVSVSGELLFDQSVLITTIQIEDYRKVVRDECFAPPALRELQRMIVEVAGVEKNLERR
jgi:hypothetical protein